MKNKKYNFMLFLGGIGILILFVALNSIFSIVSSTVSTGKQMDFYQPTLCINRMNGGGYVSTSQGNTINFEDYKLVMTYSDDSYTPRCKVGTGDKNIEIYRDSYNCPVYNSTKYAYTYTACSRGSNCPSWGTTMCARCTAKGVCDGTTYSCNGCGATGSNCFGKYSYYWDNCKCSRVSVPQTTTISGGFERGSVLNNNAGFTYELYYKNTLISSRLDFPMTDFNALVGTSRVNSICLRNGQLLSDCNLADYRINVWTRGSSDCNGDPFYGIEIKSKAPDDKLYAILDINDTYTEGDNVYFPIKTINNFNKPIKARVTLQYTISSIVGNLDKTLSYDYDVGMGESELKIPFNASQVTKVSLKPKIQFYDSGYSGIAIKVNDWEIQNDFWNIDDYTKRNMANYRIVKPEDYILIKTLDFSSKNVEIKSKYSEEYVQFITMSLAEKVQYLNQAELTIQEISQKIYEAKLSIDEQSKLISELADTTQEQKEYIDYLVTLQLTQKNQIDDLDAKNILQSEYISELTINLEDKANLILSLESERERQSNIIKELDLSIDNQAKLIDSLNLEITEKAKIISDLELTISQQSEIISKLSSNVDEQKEYIDNLVQIQLTQTNKINDLESKINLQAEYISKLTSNIEQKAELISKLTSENEIQAELINKLGLSLSSQATIIKELNNTILNDAEIISKLDLTIEQQGYIINQLTNDLASQKEYISRLVQLQLEKDNLLNDYEAKNKLQAEFISQLSASIEQKAQIIVGLETENSKQATIIRELDLSIENQAKLIDLLNKNVADDAIIISNLQLSIDEQGKLLNEMTSTIDEKIQIISKLQSTVEKQEMIVSNMRLTNEELQKIVSELKLDNVRLQELINKKNNEQLIFSILGISVFLILIFIMLRMKKK